MEVIEFSFFLKRLGYSLPDPSHGFEKKSQPVCVHTCLLTRIPTYEDRFIMFNSTVAHISWYGRGFKREYEPL